MDIRAQKVAFWPLLVIALLMMAVQGSLGSPLITRAAPSGIVSFELAGSLAGAQAMLESWGPAGRVYAGLSLGTDYVFLLAYSIAISLGCVLATRNFSRRWSLLSALGIVLAWAVLGAALLDAVENLALIQVLLGTQQAIWPALARICAVPKFLIVGLGLLYVLLGAIIWLAAQAIALRARSQNEPASRNSR
jgi:hypothetical protein